MALVSGWILPSKFRLPDKTPQQTKSPFLIASETGSSKGPEFPEMNYIPNQQMSNNLSSCIVFFKFLLEYVLLIKNWQLQKSTSLSLTVRKNQLKFKI